MTASMQQLIGLSKLLWFSKYQQPLSDWLSLTMFCKGRLTNIYDIPKHAPYLFQDPVLSSQEAQTLLSQIRREDYGASESSNISMTSDAVFRSNNKYCESQAGRYFGTLGKCGLVQDIKCGTRASWSFSQGLHESLEICIDGDEGGTTSYLFFVLFFFYKYTFSVRMDLVWQLLWKLLDGKQLSNDWNSCYSKSVTLSMGLHFLFHQRQW